MAKKKKQTEQQRLYAKQVKRIKQFIRRAEKRGYKFEENVIPEQPKRITKASVRKLEKLTPEKLYKKAIFETELGKKVKGTEGVKLERKARAQKAQQTRKYRLQHPTQEPTNTKGFEPPENISEDFTFFDAVVITGFRAHIRQFNENAYTILRNWVDELLKSNSIHDVATMLNDGAEAGYMVNYQIVYSSDKIYEYISNMIKYLPNTDTIANEFMDAMELDEDFDIPL